MDLEQVDAGGHRQQPADRWRRPGQDEREAPTLRLQLNSYQHADAGAVDEPQSGQIGQFAALAVQNEMRAQEIDNLHTALQASRRIGVAIGILMARHLVTYEQAFGMLAAASQHLNRKLRDVAADVAETGELPGGSAAGD